MDNGIHTLHEFMLHTKGQLYPLAAIFLFCLLGFWIYLTGKENNGQVGATAAKGVKRDWERD